MTVAIFVAYQFPSQLANSCAIIAIASNLEKLYHNIGNLYL
ncbi:MULTISPECIES: hypothetical protein [Oscillatoriales]|nr:MULTISPECIES: hypothetical protein [Oscillatoriales]